MNDSSTFSPEEQVLAEFALEIERLGPDGVDLESWVERFPQLEARLRGNLQAVRHLDQARPEPEPPIPERLGEFRIVRRIARGGMGDVYEAIQEPLGRRVAVKTIRSGRLSPEMQARFLQEQRVLASLHQTHIVPIHTAGQEGELQYFAMPYIEGATLHNVVEVLDELQSYNPASRTPPLGELAKLAAAETDGNDKDTFTHIGDMRCSPSTPARESNQARTCNLSAEYVRSIARVIADVADAVQHAHDKGILHRDIKPSNIMIDRQEQCWIIDFGLARYIEQPAEVTIAARPGSAQPSLTTAGALPGTPHYMAPEQFEQVADARSDVWGLGATLYELLTLRRPFNGQNTPEISYAVRESSPLRLRVLARRVPRDLEAICLKALQKDAAQRYPSVSEFADDLRRFLRDEPTAARPSRAVRRLWKWASRNKGWATAITVLLTASIVLVGFAFEYQRRRAIDAELANLVQEAQYFRLAERRWNWSERAWTAIEKAAQIRTDAAIRNQAALSLSGLDVRLIKRIDGDILSVAFAPDAPTAVFSSMGATAGTNVWARGSPNHTAIGNVPGACLAYFHDGAIRQLAAGPDDRSLLSHNISGEESVQQLRWPDDGEYVLILRRNISELPVVAVSESGRRIAAAVMRAVAGHDDGEPGRIFVWDVASSAPIRTFDCFASAIAFSPDGRLVAGAAADGSIRLWSVDSADLVGTLVSRRSTIHALAFGRNPRRGVETKDADAAHSDWLLAAGDSSGQVAVWDLSRGVPLAFCRGSRFGVHAVAFSPDGMTLASGGRLSARLWNAWTGEELLHIDAPNWVTGLEFSSDGRLLAVGGATRYRVAGRLDVWELDPGRGISEMLGLGAGVEKVAFSADGRLLAALSDDWIVGVWNLAHQRLLHLFEVPHGDYTDNAGLAFDSASRRFAFSSGTHASLWDLETGGLVSSWDLPSGLQDQLVFDVSGKLLSFRDETVAAAPRSPTADQVAPRVIRFRVLQSDGQAPLVREIRDFDRRVYDIAVSQDAMYLIVEGLSSGPSELTRSIRVYDALGEEVTFTKSTRDVALDGLLLIDPHGKRIEFFIENEIKLQLELQGGRVIRTMRDENAFAIAAGGRLDARGTALPNGETGLALHTYDAAGRSLVGALTDQNISGIVCFSPDGRTLSWGATNGSVMVCDIPKLNERLTSLGLGW